MGKAGRVACIATPWALTLASLICIALIQTAGWNNGNFNEYAFMRANFTNIEAGSDSNLGTVLQQAHSNGGVKDLYSIFLWNYCTASDDHPNKLNCTEKENNFIFDPVDVWALDIANSTLTSDISDAAPDTASDRLNDLVDSHLDNLQENKSEYEQKLLGEGTAKALSTYRHVAKWMFIAYGIAFWTTLATLIVAILAIFTRWGSFLTWAFAAASTLFNFAAVVTSTALFSLLTGALHSALADHNVDISLGRPALIAAWLSVAFSVAATAFWLMSVCCCSGRSNPHHKSNKGGLWHAEPKGQGYHGPGFAAVDNRGRGLKVEKTGGYERVASPYIGADPGHGDRVPLQQYPQQSTGYASAPAYEPFRH